MPDQLSRDIHALFLPIVPKLEISDFVTRFLGDGGISLLFGETREEYVSHVIDPARVAVESEAAWHKTIGRAREMAGPVLVAVDAEIGGIQRLHKLVPELPGLDHAQRAAVADIAAACKRVAKAASALGANVFLSPVADVLVGKNPWLEGRTLGSDLGVVSKIVEAFVIGVQEGGVVTWSLDRLRTMFGPFQAGINAGAEIVMMGPAIFSALNPPVAASLSGDLIGILRGELGFKGVVLTDDLDWKATIRDRSMEETAIAAVTAGADWMLVSANGVGKITDMSIAIAGAVARGDISGDQIAKSAAKVRALAERLGRQRADAN
jgi:beta-N-acetylhexosaminidase